jgi:hypothetical protein
MEGNRKILKDNISTHDNIVSGNGNPVIVTKKTKPLRTRVMGFSGTNTNPFEEKIFDDENQIVIGGALFILEKVFGVESDLYVDYLNNIMGIATDAMSTEVYPKDTVVCLFGVGIGGCGDSIRSVRDVNFVEREIFEMVPFRITDEELNASEVDKYWFKQEKDNKIHYYLKSFETQPHVKALWKDSDDQDEDGSEVESGVHDTQRTEPIETFVEMILKISKKDVREYFELYGDIEQCRVNSIGLFTGAKRELPNGEVDYQQVKLFSKLNIPNEMLTMKKDITIIYRIYTN